MIRSVLAAFVLAIFAGTQAYAQSQSSQREKQLKVLQEFEVYLPTLADMLPLIHNTRLTGTAGFLVCEREKERCAVPVHPEIVNGVCEARIDLGMVIVPKPKTPNLNIRVVWVIVPANVSDRTRYRFHPDSGIVFTTPNDIFKDFADPGEDSRDPRKFRWVSVNARGTNSIFQYISVVQYYNETTDQWTNCLGGDPTIANFN